MSVTLHHCNLSKTNNFGGKFMYLGLWAGNVARIANSEERN